MRALVLSGGGSKGAFTAGVVEYLLTRDKEMHFDFAVGTSTGALAGGPALINDHDYLTKIYTGVKNRNIFRNSFFVCVLNLFGIIKGPFQADLEPLQQLVEDYYIINGKLNELIKHKKELVVTAVNVRTNKVEFISSKQVDEGSIQPKTFIKAIIASCSQPVFTKPVQIFANEEGSPFKSDLFYDGGVKEFLPLEHAALQRATEIWAVSTSPLMNSETGWGGCKAPDKVGACEALSWTINGLLSEVARGDRFRADLYARWERTRQALITRAENAGLQPEVAKGLLNLSEKDSPTFGISVPQLRLISPKDELPGAGLNFDPAVMEEYLKQGRLTAEEFYKDGKPLYDCDTTLRPWIRSEEPKREYV